MQREPTPAEFRTAVRLGRTVDEVMEILDTWEAETEAIIREKLATARYRQPHLCGFTQRTR